jgi:hypothetical protein
MTALSGDKLQDKINQDKCGPIGRTIFGFGVERV